MRRLAAILAADVVGYSRLVSVDEAGALAGLAVLRRSIIEPSVAAHSGRLFKVMGDGFLVEFSSAVQAASCAIAIQKQTESMASAVDDARRMRLRIGIHVGDVIVEGEDLLGDGVNIAARLEAMAEPGMVCISRQVHDQIEGKVPLVCRSLGPQRLKNISKSVEAYVIGAAAGDAIEPDEMELKVNYCRAPDGVRLAYAVMGSGSPLVKTANWMNHLEFDWQNPDLHHLYTSLARDFTLMRYDARW
jgi:class 3 adenylate cyclase